jgi:hypothetical protein
MPGPVPAQIAQAESSSTPIDWNPVSWAKSAWSDITGVIWNPIKTWVIKVVVKAAGLIENDIDKVRTGLHAATVDLKRELGTLSGEVDKVAGVVGGDVAGGLDALYKEAASLVDAALGPVEAEVDRLAKDGENLAEDALHATDEAINYFWDHVVQPALTELRSLVDDAARAADKAWDDFDRDVLPALRHDVADALNAAHAATSFIDHSALDAIHLIDECWDWLEVLARNPMHEIEALPEEIAGKLSVAWATSAGHEVSDIFTALNEGLSKELK